MCNRAYNYHEYWNFIDIFIRTKAYYIVILNIRIGTLQYISTALVNFILIPYCAASDLFWHVSLPQ